MGPRNDIVLYHYHFSPFAKKIVWYLALRKIDYAECLQPIMPPRDDLTAIGVNYRRIPVLAHGRDVYCDTRRILAHLDEKFPDSAQHPGLQAKSPSERAYQHLLEKWMAEAGVFQNSAALLPSELPAVKDPKFVADRESLFGSSWQAADRAKQQAGAAVFMRDLFAVVEEQVLGDGRNWVLGGDKPSRADIDAVWPLTWISSIPGALPKEIISADHFPKAFAWIKRFDAEVKAALKAQPKPEEIDGKEAARRVLNASPVSGTLNVDPNDPLRLKQGQQAESHPTDYGFTHKDKGKVVGLTRSELVLESEAPGGKTVLIHYPRIDFKIKASDAPKI